MRQSLTARSLAGGLLLALVVGAALGLLTYRVDRLHRASDLENHASETIASAGRLERSLLDLETGLRGYLLGGDARFLEPYRRAETTYPAQAAELERLVAREPEQRRRATAMREAIVAYHRSWTTPLLARAQTDLAAARRIEAAGGGKRMIDATRARFDRFLAVEQQLATDRRAAADRSALVAVAIGAGAIGVAFLVVLLYVLWLDRAIVRPVRRLGRAAAVLADGVLSTRVPESGAGEIGALERDFNEMAEALEQNRDELEAQNGQLEAQQVEVESTLESLAGEQQKLARISEFAGGLVGMPSLAATADFVLDRLCEVVGADIGTLHGSGVASPDELVLRAVRGIGWHEVDAVVPPVGLAARAVERRASVTTHYGESGLRVRSLNGEVVVQDELHVPLLRGDAVVGSVSLARVGGRRFEPTEIDLVDRLATLAGVALEQARTHTHAERLAALNRTLIDSMPDGIRLLDLDGNLLSENRAMSELAAVVGASAARVYDGAAGLADAMTDPAAYRASLEALRDDPSLESAFEFTLRESMRSFRRHAVPVTDGADRPVARLFVLRETTRDRDLDRLKEQFVATVSHELRTPLASIVGFVELLLGEEPGALTAEQAEFLQIVQRSSQRLHRLVGDLLFVSRVDAGRLDLERSEIRVDEVAREALSAAAPAAAARGVALSGDVRALPPVHGDAARLGQVLDNLLSNAVKFTPAGGTVTLSTETTATHVALLVADTGIGIPESELDRLFGRFFRASTAIDAQIPGTGLGLAITKAIVEAHEGTISASSRAGDGTVFRVELPIAQSIPEAA